MHEFAYVDELYKKVKKYARSHKAVSVISVNISVSKLSGIESESFRFYWDEYTKKGICADTKLNIRKLSAKGKCMNCNHHVLLKDDMDSLPRCQLCGSIKIIITEQCAVKIKKIELEI